MLEIEIKTLEIETKTGEIWGMSWVRGISQYGIEIKSYQRGVEWEKIKAKPHKIVLNADKIVIKS